MKFNISSGICWFCVIDIVEGRHSIVPSRTPSFLASCMSIRFDPCVCVCLCILTHRNRILDNSIKRDRRRRKLKNRNELHTRSAVNEYVMYADLVMVCLCACIAYETGVIFFSSLLWLAFDFALIRRHPSMNHKNDGKTGSRHKPQTKCAAVLAFASQEANNRLRIYLNLHIVTSHVLQTHANTIILIIIFIYLYFNCRTDGMESPILVEPEADGKTDKPKVKYGELVILG